LDGETNQVVGVDIPFTAPEQPDMVVKNSLKQQDISRYAEQILTASGVLR
jgi:adenylylsulfate kinase-like enzyme